MNYTDEQVFAAMSAHLSGAENPRPVTRGSELENPRQTQAPEAPSEEVNCAFDWYRGTVRNSIHATLIEAFIKQFGGAFEPCRGMHSYAEGAQHTDKAFTVMWGGTNGGTYFEGRGQDAQDVSEFIRKHAPEHRVSRADVALDFSFSGAFDTLAAIVEPIARKRRVDCRFIGDTEENNPDYRDEDRKGRTRYYGSVKSDVMVRLYEKGIKAINEGAKGADRDWVRFEVQIKPQKSQKALAASMDPFEMLGLSKWVSKTVGEMLEEAPTVIRNIDKQEKTMEHALEHMATQYAKHLRAYVEKHGWQELDFFLYTTIYTPKERAKMEQDQATHPTNRAGRL